MLYLTKGSIWTLYSESQHYTNAAKPRRTRTVNNENAMDFAWKILIATADFVWMLITLGNHTNDCTVERQGFNSAIYVNCEFWLLQWFL